MFSHKSVKIAVAICFAVIPWSGAFRAQAASIATVYQQHIFCNVGACGASVTGNVFPVSPPNLTQEATGVFNDVTYDETGTAVVSGSVPADDEFHGYVQSTASQIIGSNLSNVGNFETLVTSNLQFTADDHLFFTSSTLPIGTPVSFLLTVDLHSIMGGDTTGNPCSGPVTSPAGLASLYMYSAFGGAGPRLFDPLVHDTCGRGSDLLSFSGIFQSTTGNGTPGGQGDFPIETVMTLQSGALVSGAHTATSQTTVDASDTATIQVQVLTPGVTFQSGSGALYSAVPEPGTWFLLGCGLLVLAAGSRLRNRVN